MKFSWVGWDWLSWLFRDNQHLSPSPSFLPVGFLVSTSFWHLLYSLLCRMASSADPWIFVPHNLSLWVDLACYATDSGPDPPWPFLVQLPTTGWITQSSNTSCGCNHSYTYSLRKKTFLRYLPQANNVAGAEDLEINEVVPIRKENEPMIRIQMICVYAGLVA